MAPKNSGKPWQSSDNKSLKQLASGNTPTRVIGMKLGRSPEAVQSQASKIGLSLKPNESISLRDKEEVKKEPKNVY